MSELIKYGDSAKYSKGEFKKIMSKQEATIKKNFNMISSVLSFYYKSIGVKCVANSKGEDKACAKDMYSGSAIVIVRHGKNSYRFNKQMLDDVLKVNLSLLGNHLNLAKNGQDVSKTVSSEKFELKAHPIIISEFVSVLKSLNRVLTSEVMSGSNDYRKRLFFSNNRLVWPNERAIELIEGAYKKKMDAKVTSKRIDRKFGARLNGLLKYIKDTKVAGKAVNLDGKLIPFSFFMTLLSVYNKYGEDEDKKSPFFKNTFSVAKQGASDINILTLHSRINGLLEMKGKYEKEDRINKGILKDVIISDEGYYVYDKNNSDSNYNRYLYGYYAYCYFNICNTLSVGQKLIR